jgi:hypothetical protein
LAYAATCRFKLLTGESPVLSLPFGYRRQSVPQPERTPSGRCHPGRHADAVSSSRGYYLSVDVGVNGDCELG